MLKTLFYRPVFTRWHISNDNEPNKSKMAVSFSILRKILKVIGFDFLSGR